MRLTMTGLLLTLALPATTATAQTQTGLTGFQKTSNIYTNLNQQYPHSGTGVPGSRTGTPNASVTFTPQPTGQGNPDNVNYANNGISYQIASDTAGHDFTEVGTADFGIPSLVIPVGIAGVTNFFLLGAAYNGTTFDISFAGTDGYQRSFTGIFLPDFFNGSINTSGAGFTDQTVFGVRDTGAGGTGNSSNGGFGFYGLTQVGFDLSDLGRRTLTSATITGNGFETLILGATVVTPSAPAGVPEPASWALMIGGFGLVGAAMRRRRHTVRFA